MELALVMNGCDPCLNHARFIRLYLLFLMVTYSFPIKPGQVAPIKSGELSLVISGCDQCLNHARFIDINFYT